MKKLGLKFIMIKNVGIHILLLAGVLLFNKITLAQCNGEIIWIDESSSGEGNGKAFLRGGFDSYIWSNGGTTATQEDLTQGIYYVTATDTNIVTVPYPPFFDTVVCQYIDSVTINTGIKLSDIYITYSEDFSVRNGPDNQGNDTYCNGYVPEFRVTSYVLTHITNDTAKFELQTGDGSIYLGIDTTGEEVGPFLKYKYRFPAHTYQTLGSFDATYMAKYLGASDTVIDEEEVIAIECTDCQLDLLDLTVVGPTSPDTTDGMISSLYINSTFQMQTTLIYPNGSGFFFYSSNNSYDSTIHYGPFTGPGFNGGIGEGEHCLYFMDLVYGCIYDTCLFVEADSTRIIIIEASDTLNGTITYCEAGDVATFNMAVQTLGYTIGENLEFLIDFGDGNTESVLASIVAEQNGIYDGVATTEITHTYNTIDTFNVTYYSIGSDGDTTLISVENEVVFGAGCPNISIFGFGGSQFECEQDLTSYFSTTIHLENFEENGSDSLFWIIDFGDGQTHQSDTFTIFNNSTINSGYIYHTYANSGSYQASLIASSLNGYSDTSSYTIYIEPINAPTLYILDNQGDTIYIDNEFIQSDTVVVTHCIEDNPYIFQIIANIDSTNQDSAIFFYSFGGSYTEPWIQEDDHYMATFNISDSLGLGYTYLTYDLFTDSCYYNGEFIINTINCSIDSVWPGDANNDGLANVFDIFPLGYAYGEDGPVRVDATSNWIGQEANDWTGTFANGLNHKYADCDGNGDIDALDVLPIALNYGLSHSKGEQLNEATEADPELYFETNIDTTFTGTTLQIPIHLGTSGTPANDVYGIAFTLNFDPSLIDTNVANISFTDSWLGVEGNDLLTLQQKFISEGQIHVGMVRNNLVNQSNHGLIATLEIATSDDLIGKMEDVVAELVLSFSDIKMVSANEMENPVNLVDKTIYIVDAPASSHLLKEQELVWIYPVPASDVIYIKSNQHIQSFTIKDITGKSIQMEKSISNSTLDISSLPSGMYLLELQLENELSIMKRFVKK